MLKRVRAWVYHTTPFYATPLGDQTIDIHRLPLDLFMHTIKLLGPKDAARLASVCKSWKLLVYDDMLWIYFLRNQQDNDHWDSILFAETRLRFGFPLRTNPHHRLSYMHLYGERAQVPGAIIIDVASGFCKIGWSKYDSPSIRLATNLELGSLRSLTQDKTDTFFEEVFRSMNVKPFTHPVILSTPIPIYGDAKFTEALTKVSIRFRETILSTLIRLKVPSVCAINQGTLALFASKRTWGILVNIGFFTTQVFPILHGEIMYSKVGVVTMKVGGSHLTKYLKRQLQHKNVEVLSDFTLHKLKENLCYVALDYEAEFREDTEASYKVANESLFTLVESVFKQGRNAMGLHRAVGLCIQRCPFVKMKSGRNWFKTIVLTGGTSRLPGLAERLTKELNGLPHPSLSKGIRVISSPYGANAAWHGAKLVSNVSTFPSSWSMKELPNSKS